MRGTAARCTSNTTTLTSSCRPAAATLVPHLSSLDRASRRPVVSPGQLDRGLRCVGSSILGGWRGLGLKERLEMLLVVAVVVIVFALVVVVIIITVMMITIIVVVVVVAVVIVVIHYCHDDDDDKKKGCCCCYGGSGDGGGGGGAMRLVGGGTGWMEGC